MGQVSTLSCNLNTRLRSILRSARKGAGSVRINILEKKLLADLGKWWLRLVYRDIPVPVNKVFFLRNLAHGKDTLFPKMQGITTTGKSLRNPFLASQLTHMELGTWSLGTSTLNFLEFQIQTLKPKVVLEFGSGISTACFARYMQELHGNANSAYVFSIEQDLNFCQRTVQLLKTLQLDKYASVLHLPLCRQVIEGIETTCYDLSGDFLRTILRNNCPTFVVVDGPAAEPGARFGTLPLVRSFLHSEAWFFLDDALRDGELKVAQLWSQLPYVRVDGIYLLDKGLLIGQVANSI